MSGSRPRVAIAHDYLTQRGGAERVVLAMTRAFPEAEVHCALYDPAGTYPEFGDVTVVPSALNHVGVFRKHPRWSLPLLAPVISRTRIEADVVIVSTSGWAHGFDIPGRTVVYCHTPPHWLHETDAYLGRSAYPSVARLALRAIERPLRAWDRDSARRHDVYLCNSRAVRRQIREVYDLDAEVLPPPISIDASAPQDPPPDLVDWSDGYDLVVSRLLPYKNVQLAVEVARTTGRRLVVVGNGPERARLVRDAPPHVRLLRGLSDAQLRWIYAHARLLLAPSREDFGLTPLEAAAFGVPTVAWRSGGYLDTVVEGRTGVFFDRPEVALVAAALAQADATSWDHEAVRAHAGRYSEDAFAHALRDQVDRLSPR